MHDNKKFNIIKVSKERWLEAQKAELELWKKHRNLNLYQRARSILGSIFKKKFHKIPSIIKGLGDDWNFWWAEKFGNYYFLPKEIDKALEVGCGPFTNIRLILKSCSIKHVYLSDPLIMEYIKYTIGFTSQAVKSGKVLIDDSPAEELPYKDSFFNLVILINVLDHVMDAEKVILECYRVIRKGGIFLIGQDLTNQDDVKTHPNLQDSFHPIRIDYEYLSSLIFPRFDSLYHKLLPREKGRNPEYHYGTLVYAGQKK